MKDKKTPWLGIILMMLASLIAVTGELLPSGLLYEISQDLGVSHAQVGYLLGASAIVAACTTMITTRLLTGFNRRYVLIGVALGFALGNFIVGSAANFAMAIIGRMITGLCVGMFWPLIGTYARQVADGPRAGQIMTIVLSGSTIGVSLGLPLLTKLGQSLTWSWSFYAVTLLCLLVAGLGLFALPSVPGRPAQDTVSPINIIKRKNVQTVLLLVLLYVMGQYASYAFIQLVSDRIGLAITTSQLIFGMGAILSMVIVSRFIDQHFHQLLGAVIACGVVTMLIFLFLAKWTWLGGLAMGLWGLSYGPLSVLLQNAVIKQAPKAGDIAVSVQSTVFDFSIMLASAIGGQILALMGLPAVLIFACAMFVSAWVLVQQRKELFI
ncbi:hypothetical protein AWM75_05555 [Aerococcus urinaehominis]|uniref:Uncharacterized protein n=1 Tax=Aerococcus urinaehominis TaxID=128944 RepID=A0A0X8FLM2_9LACT|nr:MFS transporter [Aerococcus urinaehominis]AMB99492.1 hypothetical protein AWM75_05555 [Aerococcus urinaehominis]SDM26548.1 Predicted arabinose efflux permease, MFS family [Aerococcus urinaehominis]